MVEIPWANTITKIITQPNFSKQVGTESNLWRFSIHKFFMSLCSISGLSPKSKMILINWLFKISSIVYLNNASNVAGLNHSSCAQSARSRIFLSAYAAELSLFESIIMKISSKVMPKIKYL